MQPEKLFSTRHYHFFLLLCYIAWGVWIKLKRYDIEVNSEALLLQVVCCLVCQMFGDVLFLKVQMRECKSFAITV